MFKSIRQSMAWLHGWLGLIFGWLIFIIFLTGLTSYYKNQLNLWTEPQIATIPYNQYTAIQTSYQYLQDNANSADKWYVNLAIKNKPINHTYWLSQNDFGSAVLDPQEGDEILLDNELGLGDFFYRFHFQFYSIDITFARALVSLIAFILLLTLISGIITHKKIFIDFFTLRAYKGQRTWLDVHNITAVIALPFFITITFTGLLILFSFSLPQGLQKIYQNNTLAYFTDIREYSIPSNLSSSSSTMNMPVILEQLKQHWGNAEIKRMIIDHPNQNNARITFEKNQDDSLTLRPDTLSFDAQGKLLANNRRTSFISLSNAGIYGLHLAYFAQPLVRFCLFFSGLLGCIMVASGLLMWSIKRQIRYKGEESIGQYLVNRLNVTVLVGLPIAMISAFYGVRLHSLIDPEIVNISFISCFFSFWIMSFSLSLLMPQSKLWISQGLILIILCLILPIFDAIYLFSKGYIQHFNDYWIFLRVDYIFWVLAILGIIFIKNINPLYRYIHQNQEQ